uniref:Uncharacterized protein n=1 Tax=Arundo donax TaxID=35708 RepID=A0A0A8Y9T2_ARUDO
MLPMCCFLEAFSMSFLTNMAGRSAATTKANAAKHPRKRTKQAKIGDSFAGRSRQHWPTSCLGRDRGGQPRTKPAKARQGRGREMAWRWGWQGRSFRLEGS